MRGIGVADRGDEHDVRVSRIDGDAADVVSIVQAEMGPRPAAVDRLVHPVPVADRIAERRLAAADVDRVGAGRGNGKRADRGNGLRIEDRKPRPAGVSRFPDAAVHRSKVELVRPARHAADRVHAAAAEWSEHAPAKARIQCRIVRFLLGGRARRLTKLVFPR